MHARCKFISLQHADSNFEADGVTLKNQNETAKVVVGLKSKEQIEARTKRVGKCGNLRINPKLLRIPANGKIDHSKAYDLVYKFMPSGTSVDFTTKKQFIENQDLEGNDCYELKFLKA